jgi:hypothetical protein
MKRLIALAGLTATLGLGLAACGSATSHHSVSTSATTEEPASATMTTTQACQRLHSWENGTVSGPLFSLSATLENGTAGSQFSKDLTAWMYAGNSTTANKVHADCNSVGVDIFSLTATPAPATSAPAPAATTPAPAPAPKVLTFTGHGNGSTPKFSTSGDFTVSWIYTGNVMSIAGYSSSDLFGALMHSPGSSDEKQFGQDSTFNNPSDIAATGSGNQTITGDDGTHYLTIQADVASTWTFKVTTSP